MNVDIYTYIEISYNPFSNKSNKVFSFTVPSSSQSNTSEFDTLIGSLKLSSSVDDI